MSETLSTASTHNLSRTRHCFCGLVSYIQTSRSERNPGRHYFGCPKYGTGEPHCKFFEWFDAPFCEGCCNRIPALTRENELLCHEIRNKDATIRRLQFSFIALSALILGIMLAPTILPCRSLGGCSKRMLPF
jgi:hypothetical protein